MTLKISEKSLIEKYFKPLCSVEALNLQDDAALYVPQSNEDLVFTTDALLSDVHFFEHDPAEAIAAKALRVNLSDLAAKGATPRGFMLTLGLPESATESWLECFASGLAKDCLYYSCPLFGGDTVKSQQGLILNIAMIGSVPRGTMLKRTTARAGDALYVSGTIGDAALALRAHLRGETPDAVLEQRRLMPEPRLALREALRFASAGMDVSDGLVGDAYTMARSANFGVQISLQDIPLSKSAEDYIRNDPAALKTAITGGDDYELLIAVPSDKTAQFEAAAAKCATPVRRIGHFVENPNDCIVLDVQGKPLHFSNLSYSHF